MRFRCLALFCFLASFSLPSQADVRMPQVFGDHMVLQRGQPIILWGQADPGESVSATLDALPAISVKAGDDGTWRLELPAQQAGGPHILKVSGNNELVFKDVLIGEVWLCSGQSNMQWTVNASENASEEIAAGKFPHIRHLAMPRTPSSFPVQDRDTSWKICTPEAVSSFTAVGYFFGRELHKELNVPIGLLNASWGGTLIEPWTPLEGFQQVPKLKDLVEMVEGATPGNPRYNENLTKYLQALADWKATATESLKSETFLKPSPDFPETLIALTDRERPQQQPTVLYNGMVHPLIPFGIRGAIWYQGESNHSMGMRYVDLKEALVAGWRQQWNQGEFPFYYVQIAPYQYGSEDPTILPRFWEAQQEAARVIPNTGVVVIHDVGNIKNIHPTNKQEVGRRLCLMALKRTYGQKDLVDTGPVFASMDVEGSTIRLRFENADNGLKSGDGQPLNHFELLGQGVGAVPAVAVIDGNTVVVSSPKIQQPLGVRFGWHKIAEPNLMNTEGLPAVPFRAGQALDGDPLLLYVPEADSYEMVYDLDLGSLGAEFQYTTDRSAELTGAFDRIAYLVQLTPGSGVEEFIFVAMDAFTDKLDHIAVPAVKTGAFFQKKAENLTVRTNRTNLPTGENLAGWLEFWPNNYSGQNGVNVPGASSQVYDFGDLAVEPKLGYGSMQVHLPKEKVTLFAINNWKAGGQADLGIGNSSGANPDWTFSQNAQSYSKKRLRVFVRPVK